MAAHSNILAWEIPRTEVPRGLQSMGLQESQTELSTYALSFQGVWKSIQKERFLNEENQT